MKTWIPKAERCWSMPHAWWLVCRKTKHIMSHCPTTMLQCFRYQRNPAYASVSIKGYAFLYLSVLWFNVFLCCTNVELLLFITHQNLVFVSRASWIPRTDPATVIKYLQSSFQSAWCMHYTFFVCFTSDLPWPRPPVWDMWKHCGCVMYVSRFPCPLWSSMAFGMFVSLASVGEVLWHRLHWGSDATCMTFSATVRRSSQWTGGVAISLARVGRTVWMHPWWQKG